jgi:hypothetical protein
MIVFHEIEMLCSLEYEKLLLCIVHPSVTIPDSSDITVVHEDTMKTEINLVLKSINNFISFSDAMKKNL